MATNTLNTVALLVALSTGLALSAGAQVVPSAAAPVARATAASAARSYRDRLMGVFDSATGRPVAGVEVSDLLSGTRAMTTATGTVSLFYLPDSGSIVRLRKVGYTPQTFFVAISPGDTTPITVLLSPVVELPTVVTTDSPIRYRSGFLHDAEERIRSHAGGYFIDEAAMRKWDNSTMTSAIMSQMAGILTQTGPHGETYLISARSPCLHATMSCTHPNCNVTVYVNGVRSSMLTDFNRVSPADYAIAEFYPGPATQPMEYGGPCGSLLLWTRDR
jgi:hypothetical protein